MRVHRHIFDRQSVEQEPEAHLECRGINNNQVEPHFKIVSRNPGDFETIELILDYDWAVGMREQINSFVREVRAAREGIAQQSVHGSNPQIYGRQSSPPAVYASNNGGFWTAGEAVNTSEEQSTEF